MVNELNNIRKDDTVKFSKTSPVSEVFSSMVNGKELTKFNKKTNDEAVNYIKELGERATNGDGIAVSELNALRRFTIETPVLEEVKLLSIFGNYEHIGYDETIEREVYKHVGERSREQAAGGDVVFNSITKEVYPVASTVISGGYEVDYRRIALGDMTKENEGMQEVKTDILNQAKRKTLVAAYNAVRNADGVKNMIESAGLTKTAVDALLTKMRRYGKVTFVGDFALVSQLAPWQGNFGTVGASTLLTGLSDDMMNEIAAQGYLSNYNGTIVVDIPNPYDETTINTAGDNYKTLLPIGLGFAIPAGKQSPIATWTRGGLTSLSGNDIATGKVCTRFDLEFAVDVAKGLESRIGMVYDTNLGGLD